MTFLTLVKAQSGEGPGGAWPSHSPATGATSCSPATSVTSLVGELIRPDSRRAPPDRDTHGPGNRWPRQRRNVAKTQGLPAAPIAGAPSGQALRGLVQQPDRGRAGTSCPRAPEGRPPGAGRCRARLPRSCARHGRCALPSGRSPDKDGHRDHGVLPRGACPAPRLSTCGVGGAAASTPQAAPAPAKAPASRCPRPPAPARGLRASQDGIHRPRQVHGCAGSFGR
jgi:hypothetical protein